MDILPTEKPWYKKWWGVLLIIFGAIVLFIVVYVGVQTLVAYRSIKSGNDPLSGLGGNITHGNVQSPENLQAGRAYSANGEATLGDSRAPLRIVEFADFECEYSREESFIVREVQARFPDKIYFTYRDFPLDDVHPNAFRAAEAGKCANEQGKFWAMHDKMFQNSENLTAADLKRYALESGLDTLKFNECLDTQKYKMQVEKDKADGIAAGVSGTPTFFINGRRVPGAIPKEVWLKLLAALQ